MEKIIHQGMLVTLSGKGVVQTNPRIIWDGDKGVVKIKGMLWCCVAAKKHNSSELITAVRLLRAPYGTELCGLEKEDVYVTLGQLHNSEFHSKFPEGSSRRDVHERLWNFLHETFVELGIKRPLMPIVSDEKTEISESVEDFINGVLAKYCFDKAHSKAIWIVEEIPYLRREKREYVSVLAIKLVSTDAGHSLYEYAPDGTFLFHSALRIEGTPHFTGKHAGSIYAVWEFLTDIITDYKKQKLR